MRKLSQIFLVENSVNESVYNWVWILKESEDQLRKAQEEVELAEECADLDVEIDCVFSEQDVKNLEELRLKALKELEKSPYAEQDAVEFMIYGCDRLTPRQQMHMLYGIGRGFYAMSEEFEDDEPAGNTEIERDIALREWEEQKQREAERLEEQRHWDALYLKLIFPFEEEEAQLGTVVAKAGAKLQRSFVKQMCRQAAQQNFHTC